MIQENIVTNIVLWNGETSQWNPPNDAIMLVQSTTPTKIWALNEDKTDFVLTESIGDGAIGFTYDGQFCVTNQEKPEPPTMGAIPVTTV